MPRTVAVHFRARKWFDSAQQARDAGFPVAGVEGDATVRVMDGPQDDRGVCLAELKQRVLAFAHERDWEQFHSPKNLSMALAAEAAELMENFLWMSPEESRTAAAQEKRRAAIEHELADVIIYALQFANQANIDVTSAVVAKMKVNAAKYPVDKARGRSDKYTEL